MSRPALSIAPPPPPPVVPLAAKLTVFTSQAPETITKVYTLIDGELSQVEGEHMREGMAHTVEVKSAAQLASLLQTLGHNQALSYGLTGRESIKTFSENEYLKRGAPAGAITRTKDNMNWSNGAGLMLLDYDPRDGAPALTSDELQVALATISPEFNNCTRVWWCSASSHIHHGNKELRGLRGQRVYPFVKDARDIPRAGKVLFKRLWLAGHGYIKIHKNGTTGARTIIDGEVWQTNRIDYASGAKCLNGLEQRRGDPVAIEGKLLDTAVALPDLSPAEEELYQMLVKVETLKVKPEADAIRNAYEAAKAHSDVVTSGKKPTPENIAQARAVISEALDNKTLRGEFRIILASGDSVTVNEILDNPAFYDGMETLDPIEPDYDGGRVVGKLYVAEGTPNLHSFARGENTYLLKRWFEAAPTHLHDGTPISQVPLSPPPPAIAPVAPAVPHELNKWHSLTREVDLSTTVTPPRWILPNFIAEGIALIAGGHGVGKTTTLLPLAMTAAGIHEDGYPLAPKHWRHVVYITEDVGQAKLIINGWMNHAGLDYNHLKERVHIVEASRMPPEQVVQIGQWYAQKYTRAVTTATVGNVDVLPLVVIDTMAATFELENENDNAEASRMIALLKQQFCNLPVWIVGHVSKGDLSRDGAKSGTPTLRGASAFEADANQVLYLVNDDGNRWLVRGKSRFESPWFELMIETDSRTVTALNAFGDQETLIQRWGIARPSIKTRTDLMNESKEIAAARNSEMMTSKICDFIADAEERREPVIKTEVIKSVAGMGTDAKRELIDKLLNQKRLAEITLPACVTRLPRERTYLAVLNLSEQEEYKATGAVPEHKTAQYYAIFQQSEL